MAGKTIEMTTRGREQWSIRRTGLMSKGEMGRMMTSGTRRPAQSLKANSYPSKSLTPYSRVKLYFPLCFLSYRTVEPPSWEAGVEWCMQGVEQGVNASSFWLGLMLIDGSVVSQDVDRGEQLLRIARENNYPGYGYSDQFDFDIFELSPDVAPFIPALTDLASTGSIIASYMLGNFYQSGIGVTEDQLVALQWFEQAAIAGDMYSQYEMGYAFMKQRDPAAIEWFQMSAEQGYPWAAFYLAEIYTDGRLVAQDMTETRKWLISADEMFKQKSARLYATGYRSSAYKRLNELFPDEFPLD